MARSHSIYIAKNLSGNIVLAATVKYEFIAKVKSIKTPLKLYRMRDCQIHQPIEFNIETKND